MRIRDENKQAIVKEKAIKMLVNEGFDGFSMQKLAKAAGVSPATLYIYYKDKEDLIVQLGIEAGREMLDFTMKNFDPEMNFAAGMKIQWENRAAFNLKNDHKTAFYEMIKMSPFREKVSEKLKNDFREIMSRFIKKAVENGEIKPLPIEVYWSVAFAPLYNLLRFHADGQSIGGRPFEWKDEYMYQALELVLKALKP
ncbi:MAG: TetR/AcrR family transcriptional regulator [Bacteroidetes bacterium]|nr:TetR/AcrR family transcriptional regulator [Bacteroidota bacterium]